MFPTKYSKLSSRLHYFTKKHLSTIKFTSNDIFNIMQQLHPNKAHSYDMITIRTLKTCRKPIYRPLELIFNECMSNRVFASEWKKANAVPIHKKSNKQCLENYHPVPFLPICSKILNEMFLFYQKWPNFAKSVRF